MNEELAAWFCLQSAVVNVVCAVPAVANIGSTGPQVIWRVIEVGFALDEWLLSVVLCP